MNFNTHPITTIIGAMQVSYTPIMTTPTKKCKDKVHSMYPTGTRLLSRLHNNFQQGLRQIQNCIHFSIFE